MGQVLYELEASFLSNGGMTALQSAFAAIRDNVHIEVLDKVVETLKMFGDVCFTDDCEEGNAVNVTSSHRPIRLSALLSGRY